MNLSRSCFIYVLTYACGAGRKADTQSGFLLAPSPSLQQSLRAMPLKGLIHVFKTDTPADHSRDFSLT